MRLEGALERGPMYTYKAWESSRQSQLKRGPVKLTPLLLSGLCCIAAATAQPAINDLYGFYCQPNNPYPWPCPDGARPDSIIQASDGNFYGVTETSFDSHGQTVNAHGGTIFQLTPAGKITLLYAFPQNKTTGFYDNGSIPNSLVEGSDGLLYGLAGSGGPNSASAGTAFRIGKNGAGFQVLQTFCTSCTTGGFPSSLTVGSDGNVYGTTQTGGNFGPPVCQGLGCGVVFRITPAGTFTPLHALNGTTEGNSPFGMVQASDGNLYGLETNAQSSGGGIFRLSHSGQFTQLYTFSGTGPIQGNGLMQASNGLLYGITHATGSTILGIYTCSLNGVVQNIGALTSSLTKRFAVSRLLQATDGNLWAATSEGGALNWGQVFSVSTAGVLLQSLLFNGTDGGVPTGIIQAVDGTLVGTAIQRGTDSQGNSAFGVVYSINAGLPHR